MIEETYIDQSRSKKKVSYCEVNFLSNQSKQILKYIKQRSKIL
jgi:hypothetical protein